MPAVNLTLKDSPCIHDSVGELPGCLTTSRPEFGSAYLATKVGDDWQNQYKNQLPKTSQISKMPLRF